MEQSTDHYCSACKVVEDEFEKECERDRVACSNALRAHSADNKEEGGTKERLWQAFTLMQHCFCDTFSNH